MDADPNDPNVPWPSAQSPPAFFPRRLVCCDPHNYVTQLVHESEPFATSKVGSKKPWPLKRYQKPKPSQNLRKNDKVRHFLGMGPLVMLHGVQMCTASAQNKKPLRQLASCCHLGVCLQESPFGWTTNSFQLRRLVSIEGAPKWINRNTQFRTR